jgi:acetate kinase
VPILALNAGSSSVKYALFEGGSREPFESGVVDLERESIGYGEAAGRAVAAAREAAGSAGPRPIDAVGHRIVHGGSRFRSSVLIDGAVERAIGELAALAPLHNPPALEVLEAARRALPDVPHVAAFDTAFFSDLPQRAHVYPVPWEWYSRHGIRRYGFHGLSHEGSALRVAELAKERPARRLVACHLGQGCSAAAIDDGKAAATTMGLTPIEGLMMGSRSGSIDPGILIEMMRAEGERLDAKGIESALLHHSGLLGVSGVSSDFRKVEAAAREGNARARLALEMYSDRIGSAIAALASVLGGLDALAFTGGVGEHSAFLRAAACERLSFMGILLDPKRNTAATADAEIGAGAVRVFALRSREEWMIARETRCLTATPAS